MGFLWGVGATAMVGVFGVLYAFWRSLDGEEIRGANVVEKGEAEQPETLPMAAE